MSLKSDPCVCSHDHDNVVVVITLHEDNILVAGGNIKVITKIKKQLMDKFQMPDMGDVPLVLGMEVTRETAKPERYQYGRNSTPNQSWSGLAREAASP